MERPRYLEDYEIGESRETYGRTITETDFVVHAGHTGDFFPHHMDAEFMAKSEFGGRIAHGTMIFAIGVGLTATEINPLAFSYGYDRLRFVRPVMIGDTIRTRGTAARKEDDPKRPNSGKLFEKVEVLNQRDQVVLACEHIYIVEKKEVMA
ncbi:MAG: dehydratase [Rhodobacteraceae bacterium]|nr:dehydratase [Paracoccaceae bacterium]